MSRAAGSKGLHLMDVLCPVCGEPWDNDMLHDVAKEGKTSYEVVASNFRTTGCDALAVKHNPETKADPRIGVLYELLGSDMDGAASEIEDFGLGYEE